MVGSKRGQNVHMRCLLGTERRPPTFWRRPHGRHACACGRQLGAALRPRARTGSLPQTCEAPSIHRLRWCAGRCAARGRPRWLQSFGTILAALGRPLKLAPSANQVLAHTTRPPRATTTQPTHRLLSVHGRRPLHAALEAVLMAAKRQRSAAPWRRAGACAARSAHASLCAEAREGPRSRSGRRWVVEPDDHSRLAGPRGHTAEQGGLWSPWVSSKVGV
mgnify:CR=1 FL=1